MNEYSGLAAIMALGGFVFLVVMVVSIVLYLLMAIGLYQLAQKENIEYSWLAFIPIAQLYILGKLIPGIKLFSYEVPNHEMVLPIAAVVSMLLSGVWLIGAIASLAAVVLEYAGLYYLYRRFKGETAVVWTVLSVVLPFMPPIFIFTLRNAKPVDVM